MINISIFILVILCLIVVNTGLTIKTSLGTKCNCMPEKEIPEELNDINIKDFLIEEEIINGSTLEGIFLFIKVLFYSGKTSKSCLILKQWMFVHQGGEFLLKTRSLK